MCEGRHAAEYTRMYTPRMMSPADAVSSSKVESDHYEIYGRDRGF